MTKHTPQEWEKDLEEMDCAVENHAGDECCFTEYNGELKQKLRKFISFHITKVRNDALEEGYYEAVRSLERVSPSPSIENNNTESVEAVIKYLIGNDKILDSLKS